MKIKQLISVLEKFDGNKEVSIWCRDASDEVSIVGDLSGVREMNGNALLALIFDRNGVQVFE